MSLDNHKFQASTFHNIAQRDDKFFITAYVCAFPSPMNMPTYIFCYPSHIHAGQSSKVDSNSRHF